MQHSFCHRFFAFNRNAILVSLLFATSVSLAWAAPATSAKNCTALMEHKFPSSLHLVVQNATVNEADAFCQLNGIVSSRTGIDGKHYGI